MVIQIRGIAGAANLLYDRQLSPRLTPEALSEVIDLSVQMARLSLGAPGEPLGGVDEKVLSEVNQKLHARLRQTVDDFIGHSDAVSDALASVSLVGRFDNLRQQLMMFNGADPAGSLEDS